MSKSVLYVGLDVHAQNIAITLAESGGEVHYHSSIGSIGRIGNIGNDLHSVDKFLGRLRRVHAGAELRFCYTAGPARHVFQRHPRFSPGLATRMPMAP